jgi:radical SAM protein with 4Fe4S-binding SPASM domain
MIEMLKYLFFKGVEGPIQLVHFVNTECNLRCSHCFVFGEDTRYRVKDELSLPEIERITHRLGKDFRHVSLTGGEPMLREDLSEIARMYRVNAGAKSVLVSTNGVLTDACVRTMSTILRENPDTDVAMSISIDGLNEKHDQIRGMKGAFERTLETCKAMEELVRSRLSLNINITLSAFNEADVEELYSYINKTIPFASISVIATRGETLAGESKQFSPESYLKATRLQESTILYGDINGSYKNFRSGGDILNAKNMILHKVIYDTLKDPHFRSPCYAGQLMAVLLPDGNVYPCEILAKKMGNIRDSDYDFTKLWRTPRAEEVRNYINDTKCFCTWECIWTPNILFNPRYYPTLTLNYCRMLATRLYGRLLHG